MDLPLDHFEDTIGSIDRSLNDGKFGEFLTDVFSFVRKWFDLWMFERRLKSFGYSKCLDL